MRARLLAHWNPVELERRVFWQECAAAYDQLYADPEAWAGYQAELLAWDATLADGLEPEDWTGWPSQGWTGRSAGRIRSLEPEDWTGWPSQDPEVDAETQETAHDPART